MASASALLWGEQTEIRIGMSSYPRHRALPDPTLPQGVGQEMPGVPGQRAGGLQGLGRPQPVAWGWGHSWPADRGPQHRGVGAVFCARQGPGSFPGLVGIGLLYKGEQCCGCSFAAEPRTWQGRGASELDNNCSHLLAHLHRGWEQRVPDPVPPPPRSFGRDWETWPPGEDGVGILTAQG